MRICVDIDGVIAKLRRSDQTYADLEPVPGAIEGLRAFKNAGHYIILFTARHMKTCGGNIGKVMATQGSVTLDWLDQHGIPYDEIHFGKPHADVYIDDNAVRFNGWNKIAPDGNDLPQSRECQVVGGSGFTTMADA